MTETLLMDGKTFFFTIIMPFFAGWLFAWLAARCLIDTLLHGGLSNTLMVFLTLICSVGSFACFGAINVLVVAKLSAINLITKAEASAFNANTLPALLCFGYFARRSYKNIAGLK